MIYFDSDVKSTATYDIVEFTVGSLFLIDLFELLRRARLYLD